VCVADIQGHAFAVAHFAAAKFQMAEVLIRSAMGLRPRGAALDLDWWRREESEEAGGSRREESGGGAATQHRT
jgi:hypothetical protein